MGDHAVALDDDARNDAPESLRARDVIRHAAQETMGLTDDQATAFAYYLLTRLANAGLVVTRSRDGREMTEWPLART